MKTILCMAGTTGSISGTIKDPSGAVIPPASESHRYRGGFSTDWMKVDQPNSREVVNRRTFPSRASSKFATLTHAIGSTHATDMASPNIRVELKDATYG